MQLSTVQRQLETHEIGTIIKSGIDQSPQAIARFQAFIRDKIYSDKIMAPIREVISNAHDIHKKIGQTRPFEVYVPTTGAPFWMVRDFGTGLDDQGMGFYTTMLASDKTDSNKQIGGFGAGAKAPGAYADQYTVRSIQNGVSKTWAIFIDAEGENARSLVAVVDTDEPDGLEVSVPVLSKDFREFTLKSQKLLSFWEPDMFKAMNFEVPKVEYVFQSPEFSIQKERANPVVRMGNVCYPLPTELASEGNYLWGVILDANIGDCEPNPSREQLSLIPATQAWLEARIAHVRVEIAKQVQTQLDAEPLLWNKIILWQKLQPMIHLAKLERPKDLPHFVKIPDPLFAAEYVYVGQRGGPAKYECVKTTLDPTDVFMIEGDLTDRIVSRLSNNQWKLNNLNQVYRSKKVVIVSPEILKLIGVPARAKLSEFEPAARAKVSRKGRRLFEFKSDSRNTRRQDNWHLADAERLPEDFYYIPFNGSDPVWRPGFGPVQIQALMRENIIAPSIDIIGLPQSSMDLAKAEGVEDFYEVIIPQLEAYRDRNGDLQQAYQNRKTVEHISCQPNFEAWTMFDPEFANLMKDLRETAISMRDEVLFNILPPAQTTVPRTANIHHPAAQRLAKLNKRNPIMPLLTRNARLGSLTAQEKAVIAKHLKL